MPWVPCNHGATATPAAASNPTPKPTPKSVTHAPSIASMSMTCHGLAPRLRKIANSRRRCSRPASSVAIRPIRLTNTASAAMATK
jgi:hypothetical protein